MGWVCVCRVWPATNITMSELNDSLGALHARIANRRSAISRSHVRSRIGPRASVVRARVVSQSLVHHSMHVSLTYTVQTKPCTHDNQ